MISRLKHWFGQGAWFAMLELALVAALALSLAHRTWVALAPRAIGASSLPIRSDARQSGPIVKRQLFGAAPQDAASVAAPLSKPTLGGVIAPGSPGAGRAVFKLENGKSATAGAGESISPGVVLKEVHADHVVVTRDGAAERIGLNRRAANLNAGR